MPVNPPLQSAETARSTKEKPVFLAQKMLEPAPRSAEMESQKPERHTKTAQKTSLAIAVEMGK